MSIPHESSAERSLKPPVPGSLYPDISVVVDAYSKKVNFGEIGIVALHDYEKPWPVCYVVSRKETAVVKTHDMTVVLLDPQDLTAEQLSKLKESYILLGRVAYLDHLQEREPSVDQSHTPTSTPSHPVVYLPPICDRTGNFTCRRPRRAHVGCERIVSKNTA